MATPTGRDRGAGPGRPHLVLVTGRHSYRTGAFLTAAEDLGCATTIVTDAAVALPGSAVVVDLTDPPGAAAEAEHRLASSPDAVIGTDGPGLVVAALLAERCRLPGSAPAAVRRASDKSTQRRAAQAAGLRQPRWTALGPGEEAGDPDPGPVVIKPTRRAAGQGVIRADTAAGVDAAVRRVRALVGEAEPLLVERYVPGREVALDALVVDGDLHPLALFDKPDTGEGPFFAETLLVRPGRVTAAERHDLLSLATQVVRAVGLTEGPVHVELRIDRRGRAWFLELAPRSIGGLCGRMVRPCEQALERVLVLAALGRPPAGSLEAGPPATGVFMIPVPAAGTFRGVSGLEAARSVPGITGVDITLAVGAEAVPLPEGDRYVGFVFAQADDADGVEQALRRAVDRLSVQVCP